MAAKNANIQTIIVPLKNKRYEEVSDESKGLRIVFRTHGRGIKGSFGTEEYNMIIKNVSWRLCGITSKLQIIHYQRLHLQEIKCRKVIMINAAMNRKSWRTSGQPGKLKPLIFIM